MKKFNITKICTNCKEELSIDLFAKRSDRKLNRASACKSCLNKKKAEKRALNKVNITGKEQIICKNCNTSKLLNYFYNKIDGLYGKQSICIECLKSKESLDRYLKKQNIQKKRKTVSQTDLKVCSRCQLVKDKRFFNKLDKASDGLTSWCKDCSNNFCANKRREKGKQSRSYRRDSIDRVLGEAGFKICLNCFKVLSLNLYRNSKNGYLQTHAYCNTCHNERYVSNLSENKRQHQSALVKKRRNNNPDKYRLIQRMAQANRRAKKQQASDGTITNEVLKELYARDTCYYCNQFTLKEKRTIEHKIPLSKGGLHSILNIEMACSFCNTSKKDKTELEYLQKLQQKID